MYLQPLQNVLHNNANFGVFHPSSINRDQFSPGNYSKGKKKKSKYFLSFLQEKENEITCVLSGCCEPQRPWFLTHKIIFPDLSGVYSNLTPYGVSLNPGLPNSKIFSFLYLYLRWFVSVSGFVFISSEKLFKGLSVYECRKVCMCLFYPTVYLCVCTCMHMLLIRNNKFKRLMKTRHFLNMFLHKASPKLRKHKNGLWHADLCRQCWTFQSSPCEKSLSCSPIHQDLPLQQYFFGGYQLTNNDRET